MRTRRVLLTGMSGVGKSSVIRELRERGHRAVDADDGYSLRGTAGDWVWDEAAMQELLEGGDSPLFVSGCATNQGRFYSMFDAVILLSAPVQVMLDRIEGRTDNAYGKRPEERRQILEEVEAIEPLIRRTATHEIRTDRPLDEVVEEVLRIAFSAPGRLPES